MLHIKSRKIWSNFTQHGSHICHNSPLKFCCIIGPFVALPGLVVDGIDSLCYVISGLDQRVVDVVDVALVMLAALRKFTALLKMILTRLVAKVILYQTYISSGGWFRSPIKMGICLVLETTPDKLWQLPYLFLNRSFLSGLVYGVKINFLKIKVKNHNSKDLKQSEQKNSLSSVVIVP